MAAKKTVTVRQIRSANRKPEIQAATLRGLGLGKIRRERTLEDFVKPGFVKRNRAGSQAGNLFRVHVKPNNLMPKVCHACCMSGAEIAGADD